MNTTAWRARRETRFDGGRRRHLLALFVTLAAGITGCGSDDDPATNPSTGGPGSGSTRRVAQSEDFIVACLDESENECTDYLGEEGMRSAIEAEAKRVCRLDANELQTTRCSTAKLVGRCRYSIVVDDTSIPIDILTYAPVTEATAKLRCIEGKFTPAGG